MDEKKEKLIKAIKTAVTKYGLSGVSTRNIGDVAQVNDAYIYHFFKDKEDLLLQAYIYENGIMFNGLINVIDEVHNLPLPIEEKVYICFSKVWRLMLEDPERLRFCLFYYHSIHFKNAAEYHQEQLKELSDRTKDYFESEEICRQTMYSAFTLFYDSGYSILNGQEANTEEYQKRIFMMEMAILKSQMK